jgi:hypothetical protein
MKHDIQTDIESRRTVYPMRQLIHLWANGCPRDLRGGNVSTWNKSNGSTLFSYAAPIACRLPKAVRTPDGCRVFLMRSPFRSMTTARHISHARGALPSVVSFVCADDWTGLAADLPASVQGAVPGVPSHAFFCFYGVRDVCPNSAVAHADNYSALHFDAVAELEGLRKAFKHGNPRRVAELFATADYYRRTFISESAPLAIPADAPAILAGFNKRRANTVAREAATEARLRGARNAWLAAYAGTAEAIRHHYVAAAYAATVAVGDGSATITEKVAAWESGEAWPAEGQAEGEAGELLRRTVRALLAGNGAQVREQLAIPEAVRAALPCPATVCLRGAWPKGKGWRHDFGTDRAFWDSCGINPYGGNGVWPRQGATQKAGRALVRLTADGSEIVTSDGARLPASIAHTLWKRYGALMREAATAEAAPAFPVDGAGIAFGPFTWTGWEALPAEARASGGGVWALRVGCHRIAAADLCRLAGRAEWEGGRHA